jgi:hypothetical protein
LREINKGEYSRKLNGLTGKQGNKVTSGWSGCTLRHVGQIQCLAEVDAIQGTLGKSLEDISAVHIYIVAAWSYVSFRKGRDRSSGSGDHTSAFVGCYQHGGFTWRSVGREYPQWDSSLARN